jgi:protein ImuB
MHKRFVSIWFRHLNTDRMIRRQPGLSAVPFVLATPERGRMVISDVSRTARSMGICAGMVVADGSAE